MYVCMRVCYVCPFSATLSYEKERVIMKSVCLIGLADKKYFQRPRSPFRKLIRAFQSLQSIAEIERESERENNAKVKLYAQTFSSECSEVIDRYGFSVPILNLNG